MKRRPRQQLLLKLGVFLLLGAIVNVAMAWGLSLCSANLPISRYADLPTSDVQWIWNRYGPPGIPPAPSSAFVWYAPDGPVEQDGPTAKGATMGRCHRFGIVQDVVQYSESGFVGVTKKRQPLYSERWLISEMRAGFPCTCMSMGTFHVASTGTTKTANAIVRKVVTPIHLIMNLLDVPSVSAMPYHMLWPGFAINTIFYAAILAVLFYGPGKVRRFVRVRRYRCPACAYLIAPGTCASGLCSECGATLPGRLVRPAAEGTAG